MQVEKPIIPGLLNGTGVYSPITLNREWSTLGRLAVMVFASCFGATINGFFISSFFVDRELRHKRNVFHACVGFADMFITGGVLPMSAVVLLSGVWDVNPVCHVIQTLVACSTYCYSMSFALVSGETYFRVRTPRTRATKNTRIRISFVVVCVFSIGILLSLLGTYLKFDYDYCQRKHSGNFIFRRGTSVFIHGTAFVWTLYTLGNSSFYVRTQSRLQPRYRKSVEYHRDIAMIRLNLMAYLLYVTAWIPYLIVVNFSPAASDTWYYHTAWLGVSRPLLTSLLYGSLNTAFGRAYSNIFNYCFCKTSLQNYPPRQRRILQYIAGNSDVRIHVMQQMVNQHHPQRPTTSTRDV